MTDNTQDTRPILVLGGTGKTGHRVVERLTARGMLIRMVWRSADPPFDWEDQATWDAGVCKAHVRRTSLDSPDLAIPGASEAMGAFAELALEQGVRRLVLLPGRGEEESERAEWAVQESGCRRDRRMVRLVHAELQRKLPVGADHGR